MCNKKNVMSEMEDKYLALSEYYISLYIWGIFLCNWIPKDHKITLLLMEIELREDEK